MCAALFNDRFAGMTNHAVSAGLAADSSPISANAIFALEDFGIRSTPANDYKNHVSHSVTESDLERADEVICVSSSHMMALIMRYPGFASKITSLPFAISDPYGGSIEEYKKCLSDISSALSEIFTGSDNGL
jgi:protein-tyrosine-phosphatase